jgi:asparagine synthase (glutamine-hydrolysing)
MGAIFGFSGPGDHYIEKAMSSALAHRGKTFFSSNISSKGTICFQSDFEKETRQRLGQGLIADNDLVIALTGYLVNPPSCPEILPFLLNRYREQGIKAFSDLQGAYIIIVRDNDTFHLIRDGAGVRTVYFAMIRNRFFFAVEPKGILAVPDFPRKIRPGAVAQYLTFSFIPGQQTMLQGLEELPAGHRLKFFPGKDKEPELERFFIFEDNTSCQPGPEDDAWPRHFSKYFQKSVKDRLRLMPGESVGVFLSGGLDSSIVAAEVARHHSQTVRSFCIHFGKKYPNELEFARAAARACGTEHEEVLIRPKDFLPKLRRMIYHLDDPIGDPITLPNFELARRVSRDIRWIFNGEGGDPVFGGPKNIPMLLHHWYGGIKRDKYFRERMYLASYQRAYDDLKNLLNPDFFKKIDQNKELIGVLSPYFNTSQPPGMLEKLLAMNIRLKGAHLILPKVDRMIGAWGITPMAPLFDERLIKFAFQIPGRMKLAGGIEKLILKKAYSHILPEEIINRPKSGMRVPVHFWFQKEMKRYARSILKTKTVKEVGIFNPERVNQLLKYDIEALNPRFGLRLWMLITFEIWRRIIIEGEAV